MLMHSIAANLCVFFLFFSQLQRAAGLHHISKRSGNDLIPRKLYYGTQIRHRCSDCRKIFEQSIAIEYRALKYMTVVGLIDTKNTNKPLIKRICVEYEALNGCFQHCLGEEFREKARIEYEPLDFLCVQEKKKYLHNIDCYAIAGASIDKECDPRCGNLTVLQSWLYPIERAKQSGNFHGVQDVLQHLCRSLECRFACVEPLLNQICSNVTHKSAAVFLKKYMQRQLITHRKMLHIQDAEDKFPNKCQDLIDNDFKPNSAIKLNFAAMFHLLYPLLLIVLIIFDSFDYNT